MGYSTDFYGEFTVEPPLTPEHRAYLNAFADIRHMKRDADVLATMPDPVREAVALPIGHEGAFYVGSAGDGNFGQTDDPSVLDHNEPPGQPGITPPADPANTMADFGVRFGNYERARVAAINADNAVPGLWNHWRPDEQEGTTISWDGSEKFYDYVPWIAYLVRNFLAPWGYTVNGEVDWAGEEHDDRGRIKIVNNEILVGEQVPAFNLQPYAP